MNKTFKRIIYVVHLSLFVLVLGGLLLPVLSGGDVILNETGQSILDLCFKLTDDEGYRTQWQDMRMLDDIDGLKSRLLLLKNANEIRVKIREVQVGLNKEITV